jgi:Flp pilus assembly protein TadG
MTGRRAAQGVGAFARRFHADERGANAIEFSLLAIPFITLLMFVLQIGLYNASKMALDTGVLKTSEDLQARFNTGQAPVLPAAGTLKSNLASYAGGFIDGGSNLKVEVQPLQNLSSASVAITDGLANYGSAKTVLAIRASYVAVSFVPGMSNTVTVYSSALVRRQSQ